MRLALRSQRMPSKRSLSTYVFDLRACMHSDDVTMLDAEVVSDNAVHASTSIIKVIIGQNDQDSILPLLAFD